MAWGKVILRVFSRARYADMEEQLVPWWSRNYFPQDNSGWEYQAMRYIPQEEEVPGSHP